jgi:broad specificity phosphatase PhoE
MFKPQVDKTVYLLRHGQSIDNVSPVFQSEDSPLSKNGKVQAEHMAKRVSKISFETLIASPLLRTKQTAEIISKSTGKVVEFSELFVERIKPRNLYGKPYTDEKANNLWRSWEQSLYTEGMRVEDGENFDDLMVRADKALNFLKERSEKSMVVVTHGYFLRTLVIRVLLGDLLKGDLFKSSISRMLTENTGLTVIQYRDSFEEEANWKLWVYNDHAHLAG